MKSRETRQKKLIQEKISTFDSFFNADELHTKVVSSDSNVGIATIYRFLKKLVHDGKIHTYSCDRRVIYSTSLKNHCHFICQVCGDIQHISIKKVDFLKKEVKGKICHFQLDMTGTCENCLN